MSKNNGVVKVMVSSGIELATRPVSTKMLELFQLSHVQPEPPMREAAVAGGGVELVPDEEDEAYKARLAEFNRVAGNEFITMILDMGVELPEPNDNTWVKRLMRMGVIVPDDPDERKLVWVQTFLMPDYLNDLKELTAAILRQSGVSEEAVDSWVDLFQRSLA